jgi:hypothetical protein
MSIGSSSLRAASYRRIAIFLDGCTIKQSLDNGKRRAMA